MLKQILCQAATNLQNSINLVEFDNIYVPTVGISNHATLNQF